MGDDGAMDMLEVLDEAFAGCVDPRELVSKMNDPSEVHVNSPLKVRSSKAAQAKRQKRQAQIGLASNALGITAGVGALAAAGKDERLEGAGKVGRAIQKPYKLVSATKAGQKWAKTATKPKVAGGLALGAVGLQTANLAGDAVANRVLNREAKKKVQKSLDFIVASRRMGAIDSAEAIEMSTEVLAAYEEFSKGLRRAYKLATVVPQAGKTVATGTGRAAAKLNRQMELERQVDEVIPKGRKLLAGLGLGTAAGAGAAAGAVGHKKLAQRPQVVSKADDVEWTGTITKRDDEKRLVFGWASVSKVNDKEVVDRQGDYVPIETTEDAAYRYVLHSRKGGDMHKRVAKFGVEDQPLHTADLVESMVFTPEKLEAMGLARDALPEAWWVGFKVHDEQQWLDYKAGKRPSFSIHGSGKRVDAPELAHV